MIGVGVCIVLLILMPAIVTSGEKHLPTPFDKMTGLLGNAAFEDFMERRAGKKGDFVNYMVPVDQPLADGAWSSQSTDAVAYNNQRKTEAIAAQDENKDFYCNVSAQVFVSTDKPMYKPGDIVFVKAYLLTVDTKLPLLTDDAE